MKTEDLISLLSKDTLTVAAVRTAIMRWLPVGIAISCLGFVLTLGFRANSGDGAVMMAVGMKVVGAIFLAAAGCFAAVRLANPERSLKTARPVLLLTPVLLAVFVLLDLWSLGLSGLPVRILGMSSMRCLVSISVLAAFPLVAMMMALRHGATVRPTTTGALAGLTAAGLGAAIYALNCGEDSPLFVAVWYGAATLILAGIGAMAGRRFLAW